MGSVMHTYFQNYSHLNQQLLIWVTLYYIIEPCIKYIVSDSQYGNFKISLPLRFYVKSILAILNPPKTDILSILAALNFKYLVIFDILKVWNFQKFKIHSLQKWLKWQFFTSWNQPKLISSRKIRVPGKLPKFHTVEYP